MSKHFINLGQRIRDARLAQRMTIEQLGERIGKSHNFVGNIERGEGSPSVQTLIDIANVLCVGTDFFLQDYLTVRNNDAMDLYNPIMSKLQSLSLDEQKDIWSVIEIMIHFKSL